VAGKALAQNSILKAMRRSSDTLCKDGKGHFVHSKATLKVSKEWEAS